MLSAVKEFVLPIATYLMVMFTCFWAIYKRPEPAVFVYAVLVSFPQFWYPTHDFPLGAQTLSLLVVSALLGTVLHPGKDGRTSPHAGYIALLIVYTYLSLWMGSAKFGQPSPLSNDNIMLSGWKNYAMMLMLYVVAYRAIRTEKDIQTLVTIFAVVLLLTSWREFRNFYSSSSFSYARRAEGTFPMVGMGATHYGAFIAHVSAMLLGVFAMDDKKWRRWLCLGALLAGLYPLFYSYSRGAYVALVAAAALVGAVKYRPLLIGLAVLSFAWEAILPDTVVERITMTENEDGEIEESAAMRLVLWALAKELFADNPVFGIGYQSFFYASANLPLHNVHNYFLQVAAEQGIVGAILLAAFFIKATRSGWRLFRDGSSPFLRGTGLGFLACLAALVVSNLFGDRFSQLELGSYVWLLFGAVDRGTRLLVAPVNARDEQRAEAETGASHQQPSSFLS